MAKLWITVIIIFILAGIALTYFSSSHGTVESPVPINNSKSKTMTNTLHIQSTAFEDGGMIPSQYTCEGKNIIPPLQISGVPTDAKSLALIMDDPDAPSGTFVHWVKWNISTSTKEITEGVEPEGVSGSGGSGKLTYIGPCPPSGTHHYHFKLYTLDSTLSLEKGSTEADLENAMSGHIIEQAELIGLYQKKN